jgi:SPP1 family predicted phage head-tail adaptor
MDAGIESGALDKRVTLLSPVYNDTLDEIIGWTAVTRVWAGISPTVARETNQAGATVAINMITVVIRYRADVDARWRIQDRTHTYQIKGINNVLRRDVQLQLLCEDVQ